MSLKLNINPIEIPELLHLIGVHLSTEDLKMCMLVSRTWHSIFEAYFWHHLDYDTQGIPNLGQHGHLVRRLNTYNLGAKDLYLVAGSCHFVQQLKLDVAGYLVAGSYHFVQQLRLDVAGFFTKLSPGLEMIVANMPHITDLTLWLPHSRHTMYLCAISRLKELRYLTLSTIGRLYYSTCDLKLLFNVMQQCTRLSSLKLENILALHQSMRGMPAWQPAQEVNSQSIIYPPGLPPWYIRWLRRLDDLGQKKEEPWRKFGKVTHVDSKVRHSDQHLLCEPAASKIYPLLSRLDIKNVVAHEPDHQALPLGLLFKKAPYLKEFHLDFIQLSPTLISGCLDTITENCKGLSVLSFDRLHATVGTQASVNKFFRMNRPGLQRLTLKRCTDLEKALDLIPDKTASGLQHLRLEEAVSSHLVMHRLLQRCSSLQSLAWTRGFKERITDERITDPTMRLSAFLEPWACYDTLRHIEFRVDTMDKDSFDAFFRRLAQMDRLVSISIPLSDLRRSIIKRGDDIKGWNFPSVQELTIMAHFTEPLRSPEELRYTLQAFPKLRKIRYEGTQYPLDDEARQYFASQVERSIMIIHTTQAPKFVQ